MGIYAAMGLESDIDGTHESFISVLGLGAPVPSI